MREAADEQTTLMAWAALERRDAEAFFACDLSRVDFEGGDLGPSRRRLAIQALFGKKLERLALEAPIPEEQRLLWLETASGLRDMGLAKHALRQGFKERDEAAIEKAALQGRPGPQPPRL